MGLTSAVPCSPEHTLTERSWTGDGAPLQCEVFRTDVVGSAASKVMAELAFLGGSAFFGWIRVLIHHRAEASAALRVFSKHIRPEDNAPELLVPTSNRRVSRVSRSDNRTGVFTIAVDPPRSTAPSDHYPGKLTRGTVDFPPFCTKEEREVSQNNDPYYAATLLVRQFRVRGSGDDGIWCAGLVESLRGASIDLTESSVSENVKRPTSQILAMLSLLPIQATSVPGTRVHVGTASARRDVESP